MKPAVWGIPEDSKNPPAALNQRIYRFGELRKAIPGITQHIFTAQLRELEGDGLVSRTIFSEVPPRAEYAITDRHVASGRLWRRSQPGGPSMAARFPPSGQRGAGGGRKARE